MKRLVWFLVAVVCTALAQVQPLDSPVQKTQPCCCCEEEAGACGMPDCAPAPVACRGNAPALSPVVQRAEDRKLSPAPRARFVDFYVRFESRPALVPAPGASLAGAPAAPVPLFKAHCSFLI
jgi:hypothetical protein